MMGTETPTVITSLTSTNTGGSRKNKTTSLSAALASTVADYMCEGGSGTLRKNGELMNNNNNNINNPLNSPSSTMAPLNNSNGHGRGKGMPPPPPRASTTISENNNSQKNKSYGTSTSTSTLTVTSNDSSMGSTIADLASICNFRQHATSSSAPIISGTAAEVLALQNALSSTTTTTAGSSGGGGAIVSNPSSVESPPTSTSSPSSSSIAPRNASDGAPMISGTAATQMAIATAAKITENGGHHHHHHHHTQHHGVSGVNNNENHHDASYNHDVDAVARMNVDNNNHHNSTGGAGLRQISPEDFSSSATSFQVGNSSDPSSSNWNQTLPLHIQSSSYAKGGARGMDILAEITCHAPPMPLLQNQTQHHQQQHHHLAESIPSYQQIYRQVKHRVSAIPSYQEIYREMGQQQQMSPTSSAYYHHNQKHDYLVESVKDVSNGSQHQHHHSTNSHFGHPPSRDDMIEEGKELYTRKDLVTYGGHLCENKDVHGNMKDGCDSIVIANLEKDIREGDGLLWFLFSTDRTNGGGALCKAFHRKLPVRVFRSSTLSGRYAPPYLDDEENEEDDEIAYRYDGLYTIDAVWDVHGNETDVFPCGGVDGWQTYFFTRVPKRPLEKEKHVAGMQYNKLGLQELWSEVQKMRGVRRPKKFEIPMAPMKLPAMKRNAITGQNASRKVGAYRPPSLEELQKKQREEMKQQAKLLKRQQSSSSKGSMNGLRRGDDHSQSSEEVDEEGNHGDTDGNDSEESESMHHSASPISRKSSSGDKVVTPRPRLNSSASSRSKRNTDYDSSDSESSTTAGRTRRSPTKQMSSPRISATAMDSSLFFPKRASAAKAESANREMFGKKKRPYNRKSTARGGGRKRKKMDESDDDSSDEGDVVDQAVLTIGSRALVQYKGSLFKATIRKRREKNGKHSFLIHYDGNKKTNVHWVPLEHITEILHICLDAPPPATTSRGGAVKRKTKKAKRPAVQKNNRPHSGSEDETPWNEESSSHQKHGNVNRKADSKDDVVENKDPDDDGEADKTDLNEQSQLAAVDVEAQDEKQTVEDTDDMDIDEPGHSVKDDESLESESKSAVSPMKRQSRKTVVLDLERASPLNKSPEKNKESDEDTSQSTSSKPKEEFKYPIGSHVYVEYGRSKVLYHSTVINARKKRTVTEYLVHYDGYKKSANRWVKESTVHEVSSHTTRRFDEQRNVPEEILYDATSDKSTRGRKSSEQEKATQRPQNKPPRRMRSDISELSSESILGNIAPGVAFLQGSMVFAEWKGVLFLAKMVKKRYSGDRTEYLVSYDGFSSKHDAWVSIHKIYEINHQTKRAFKQLKAGQNAPGAKKRVSRKREEEEEEEEEEDDDGDDNTVKSVPKKRVYRKRSVEEKSIPTSPTRRGSRKKKDDSSEMSARSSARTSRTSTLDMQGIESGVDFLPGSTIFAEYKGGLCLAKMIKKRGKGDYMEYYIQYMGLKKSEETWMSVGLLYEINPQTKRMFRQYSKS